MSDGSRVVLLTGVGRPGQVGEAVARVFAERGATVLLVDRSSEAEHAAGRLRDDGHRAVGYRCDLADPASLSELAAIVAGEYDGLDALVHMAGGFALSGPIAESDLEVWRRQLMINLDTAYLTTRSFLPALRKRRGAMVLFASEAVLPGSTIAGTSAYAVAKSGVAVLARAIAEEETNSGVRANAVAPSAIRTASNEASMGTDVRYVEREEVAEVVWFLASRAASAINGQVIRLS